MTKKLKARTAQTVLSAEFTFNFDDTMDDVAGVEKDFGLTNIAASSFAIIPLPAGATLISGEVVRTTAFDTAGYAVTVGDSGVANRYLTSTDLKDAGRTALVPTGYVSQGEAIRIGITNTDVCTTGKATVRVQYTMENRVNEVHVK